MGTPSIPSYIAPFMKASFHILAAVGAAAFLWFSCDGTGLEPSGETPVLSDPWTSFDDSDNRFYAGITVTLPSQEAALDSVWTQMYLASGDLTDSLGTDTLMAQEILVDDATEGDILPLDGVYARKFDSPLPKGTGDSLRFEFYALVDGDTSTVTDILSLTMLRPVIISVVLTKDTFPRPDSGYVVVDTIYATVVDPDGLEDIRSVTFQIVKPDGTLGVGFDGETSFPLYDNGPPIDVKAGDGIYSDGVTFGYYNPIGTYSLKFVAKDFNGAVSDTVTHTVVVQ